MYNFLRFQSIVLILLFVLIASDEVRCQEFDGPAKDYTQLISDERKVKDKEFRSTDTSPLTNKQRKRFKKIEYYTIDVDYKVKADFKEHDEKVQFLMPTSTDRLPVYNKFGEITFVLKGRTLKLQVYQNIELVKKPGYENHLFIPFTDRSNGFGSYGGGRYLDIEQPDSNEIWIDFNKSYNPYCAYNHNYSCPIPPEENNLELMILAGERAFK